MQPNLDFGRAICGDPIEAARREWLVTNGLGGYAAGTISGELTRRYHGLLIAALQPPLGRTLLVSKFEETAVYDGGLYPLYTNRWADGSLDPPGHIHLERFHLEGTTPVWTYALADALLEKRVWMQSGANTTYVLYRLARGSGPLELAVKVLLNYRDHHHETHGDLPVEVEHIPAGLRVHPRGAAPYVVLAERGRWTPRSEWFHDFLLGVEVYRGFEGREDLLFAAELAATLAPGETLTLVVSTDEQPGLDGLAAYRTRLRYEQDLVARLGALPAGDKPALTRLALAADQFIVRRPAPEEPDGHTVIAGYPWFNDWGRDTMIALPGLTLAAGRPEIARSILRTFSRYVDQGMLPNRFPDTGETPEYNTVDATLWYFEALRAYYAATGDAELLAELFPVLAGILEWHRRGTRFNIGLDETDGLLYAGEPDLQLTWMDAKAGNWVVTPRIGKPVEVNALWYNALRCMADFAQVLGEPAVIYRELADQAQTSFDRFWYAPGQYLYDVITGLEGDDASLRPNQLLAVSLPYSPLDTQRQKAVVDACARSLFTSYGLRSLAPDHPEFQGHYGGDVIQRDGAYHQGTVWSWLMGPFVAAHLRVYGDRPAARAFLTPVMHHLSDAGLGSISEIFDGEPPFTPRGCSAQAWSVAEYLRLWRLTAPA